MAVDYAERMRSLRNEQLIEIAHALPADGFEPEAVHAARAALSDRALPEADIERLDEDLQETRRRIDAEPYEPLSKPAWAFFMLLGLTNIGLIAILAMIVGGKRRKVEDAFTAILAGLVTSWVLVGLFLLISVFVR
jgi:hypothetical protein